MNEELLDDELIYDDELDLEHKDKKAQKWLNIFLFLQLLAAIIATGLAWFDIETILGTGPGGSAVGIVVFVMARRLKDKLGIYIGLSAPILTLGCTLLIMIFNWGPGDAQMPIALILSFYTLFLLIVLSAKEIAITNRIK